MRKTMESIMELKTFEERKKALEKYLNSIKETTHEKNILTKNDFWEKSKKELCGRLYDVIWETENYPEENIVILEIEEKKGNDIYFLYHDKWIWEPDLYNIINEGRSVSNVFCTSTKRNCYSNLKYLLEISKLENIKICY